MNKRINDPKILEANLFYFMIAFLLLFLGSKAQQWDLFKGLIITEYLIILLPTVLIIVIRNSIVGGSSLKRVLRLNPISIKQAVLIPIITIFCYPIAVFFNYIGILIISRFGSIKPTPIPVPQGALDLLVALFVVSISAGICEEVMFRGFMMKAYEKIGVKKAIIITSILFGVFHFNPQNLLGPIFLGGVFAILLIKTNSIYSAILSHAVNNAFALFLSMGLSRIQGLNPDQSMEALEQLNNMPFYTQIISYALAFIGLGSIVIGCGFAVYFLIKALPKSSVDENNTTAQLSEENNTNVSLKVLTVLPLAIIFVFYIWVSYNFITM